MDVLDSLPMEAESSIDQVNLVNGQKDDCTLA